MIVKSFFEAVKSEIHNFRWKLSETIIENHSIYTQPASLKLKPNDSSEHIDTRKDILRSGMMFSIYAPIIIESYIWLYNLYAMYTVAKTIVLIPIEVSMWIINCTLRLLPKLNQYSIKNINMHAFVLFTVSYLFTLNEDIFDISFMYHTIRGQSNVKLYAIFFALETAEELISDIGLSVYHNVQLKLERKNVPFYELAPEFLIECLYVCIHSYWLFVQFVIFSVVMNSTKDSFIIFWAIVILTKMKSSNKFNVDIHKYRSAINRDSKNRIIRILFVILYQISLPSMYEIPSYPLKLFFIVFVEELIVLGKHMLYLLSSYTGYQDRSATKLREELYHKMYLEENTRSSIEKCAEQDLMVFPLCVLVIKVLEISIASQWHINWLAICSVYMLTLFTMGILFGVIVMIKVLEDIVRKIKIQKLQSEEAYYEDPNPLLEVFCIDVLNRLFKDVLKKSNPNNIVSVLKMMAMENQQKLNDNEDPLYMPEEFEESGSPELLKRSSGKKVKIKKTESRLQYKKNKR